MNNLVFDRLKYLDKENIILKGKIKKAVEYLEKDPELTATGINILNMFRSVVNGKVNRERELQKERYSSGI